MIIITDFTDMLSKAKVMQDKMKEAQEKIKKIEVEGVSGGNLVKVVLSGDYELKLISISDEAKKENQEIINDLIIAAYNKAKENLKKKSAEELSKITGGLNLPLDFKLGLGPKSAKRIILKLINNKDNMVKPLAKSLAQVYKKVVRCVDCGNLKIIDRICICSSDNAYDKICVVENLADMWVIDSANIYKGYYHILGGTLNSSEHYEQKNLLIDSLVKRIKKNNLKEVIIATSATVEGQTTAHYIEDTIKSDKIKITKLAQGLPVGGEIEQLDDGTLFSAFKNRVPVTGD